ncbi:WxL domain-containing protein [Enterococcus sp. DIV0385]|uniref:WxL domain-containing protein n=1 Tax=Enterococcus sp. DIV0385 TaxID=2775003 RepID=UPI000A33C865|nr:hypothetical protein A5852_003541 [Enterococcus faecium]
MTTRFRRPMLALGTTILIIQAVFMPVGMVYAETTMDTEEQELMELPPMKNYLAEEQISDPRFFFTRSRMQGTAEEPLQVTFFSDQEVSEARVFLPEEATLLKDQLPTGISVEEGAQPNEWIVQSKRAQKAFVLPLVVEQVGNYELSVEETTAHLEISEKEETSEEVTVEEAESAENDPPGQEELKEENEIEESQENEQPVEEVREPVSEAPKEQQTDEEESDEASQVVEPTVFDGKTAEVATMAEFKEAVGNPDIGIISVQANLTEATANVLTVDRPLLIQGNGYTLTFGINGYFQLEEVTQASTIRLENATLTKVGVTPLINATVESSKNWTVELEDITELNVNTMRLASLPEGRIHFTGGVSNFVRTTSAQTFIEAKEVLATNQAEVTISRGNATVFFSSATVADPKITVEQGATVTITTTSAVANTIDLRGEKPEVFLQSGELDVFTVGSPRVPTDTTNNTIALTGTTPKITMNSGSQLTVRSTLAKRGIHLAGNNAQLLVNDSELSVTSDTQATINITGEASQLIFYSSTVSFTSSSGHRINLIGSNPILKLKNSQLDMKATTGRGIYLQGTTPQVLMDESQIFMTDTGSSQGMILQGTDALLSLSNESELSITGAGTGIEENIQIGASNARPELSVTGKSKLSVTTTSGDAAATNTTNNAIHLLGTTPKLNIQDATLDVNIVSGAKRGIFVNGLSADILFVDSSIISSSAITAYALQSVATATGSALIKNTKVTIPSGNFAVMTGETLEINNSEINSARLFHHALNVVIKNNSYVKLHHDGSKSDFTALGTAFEGVLGGNRNGQTVTISSGATVDIKRTDGTGGNGFRMGLGNSTIYVEQGGKLYINNLGTGTPSDSQNNATNAAVSFRNGNNNKFIVKDPVSEVSIIAENGAAITNSWSSTKFSMDLEVNNGGVFSAVSNTATTASGTFNVSTLNVNFDNPLFLDFRNLQSNGGVVFSTDSASTLTASNSDLALWQRLSNLDSDPTFNFRRLDYSFSGSNLSRLVSTSSPEELNTSVIGTSGLSQFSRLSSNNGRWAIADELRVPTNADKKIHGRVSLPVGLYDNRPAWDDEALVTVEVESPSREKVQEYTAKTVGDTNESPGISIYGEEPRGGLFEIDLDEPLEAGSKVRISKVELTSGELTDGFEHQILTDTVEVFPIIPPTRARFSSSIIAKDSNTIQGTTDNLNAEVTATHNGEPLNTEAVTVDAAGRFTLDLSEVSLEMDDEIQIFLRDAEGSAVVAGVVNPPETNNTRGNINPSTELTFHDVTFESATTLIVGDVGTVSPVDPLDPEVEVNPEDPPKLPENQGALSIDFASRFSFGQQGISTQTKNYYAQPQRLLNPDGTINAEEERPNYVQISDRRDESDRHGWTLSVTQNGQFINPQKHELKGSRLQLTNQQLASVQNIGEPELSQPDGIKLIPGEKTELMTAKDGQGIGTWIYRFGDAASADKSVVLEVPPSAAPQAATYQTTLTWELSMVPDN